MSTQPKPAAHTPGPWAVGGLGVVIDSDQTQVAIVWVSCKPLEEQDANARLIAAAPELLKMLKELAESALLTKAAMLDPGYSRSQDEAREAIAKAEGRE